MRYILAIVLAIVSLSACDSRECIQSHYETRVVLENVFTGVGANGQAQYQMRPVVKQVWVCDEYAAETPS